MSGRRRKAAEGEPLCGAAQRHRTFAAVGAAAGRPHTRSVAYFGTYQPDYPRNAVLITGLRESGVDVREFRAPLPPLTAS